MKARGSVGVYGNRGVPAAGSAEPRKEVFMKIPEEATLLRIFIGKSGREGGKPLYERIVMKARELDLAGATAIKGILGFGADSRIHAAKLLSISDDLPIIGEIVDSGEKIQRIIPFLDEHITEGPVTMEKVRW